MAEVLLNSVPGEPSAAPAVQRSSLRDIGTKTRADPELSILIVSYNTRALTCACLRSVYAETHGLTFEILVVDNASSDGSAQAIAAEFARVRLVALDRNLGFAAGNNRAACQATGEWLLLLNPDTVILDGAIDRLLAFARAHPEHGIFGGRILTPARNLDPQSCYGQPTPWSVLAQALGLAAVFPRSRWFNRENLPGWDRDTPRTVDIVAGCFFLLRRELWDRLQGFDPAFFMYAEEADLCLRARALLQTCIICPEAVIVHYGGASEHVQANRMVRLFRAKAQLFAKHWSPRAARFGVRCLDLWAYTRVLAFGFLRLIEGRHATAYATWRCVWQCRDAWNSVLMRTEPLATDY